MHLLFTSSLDDGIFSLSNHVLGAPITVHLSPKSYESAVQRRTIARGVSPSTLLRSTSIPLVNPPPRVPQYPSPHVPSSQSQSKTCPVLHGKGRGRGGRGEGRVPLLPDPGMRSYLSLEMLADYIRAPAPAALQPHPTRRPSQLPTLSNVRHDGLSCSGKA